MTDSELIYLQQCGTNRIKQMNSIGIFTLEDLINADEDFLKQLPGVYDWHVKRWKLQAESLLKNKTLILKKPPDHSEFIYYDIETDVGQTMVWLIGVYNPQKDEFKQFLAKTPKEEKSILNDFLDYINKQTPMKLCSYSGSRFDRRVLQKRFCNYSMESLPFKHRMEMDLGIEIQHMLLAKIKDYQLKTVGNFFGYPWKYKNKMDGLLVALTYQRYQRDNTYKINWKQLLKYNKDDVLAIPHIIKKMNEIYKQNIE